MGFIRGGLLIIASVLLFIGLIIMNSLFIFSTSLEYENLQDELVPVVTDFLSEQMNLEDVSEEKLTLINEYCENNSEFVFAVEDETFAIPCEIVSNDSSSIVNGMVSDKVNEIYYGEYDCGFFDCFGKYGSPYFLVSEKSKDYFSSKSNLFIIICLVLSIAVFFLVEKKSNAFFIIGGLMTFSSLIFIKMDSVAGFFADKAILNIFSFLFTTSYSIALKGIIIGLLIIAIGFVMKFFKIGFWISNLIQKFKKNKTETKVIQKEKKKKIPEKKIKSEKKDSKKE